ncbi:SIS domain-containing protein [Ferviditalea candida]|uniref:Glutamine--fructose-6-phosphate aminotransferase [isomerizing] n=1 Tax=Ferviditalea candida TaxID=3108399 RepID=A0ABU5ZNV7_9BACL|nr:SIS domain-containing protein [Paenibacillaceae bacterium T2]
MSQFWTEVRQQPEAIRETVNQNKELYFPKSEKPLLFTGMGSSLIASEFATSYLTSKGIHAHSIDNSELLYYNRDIITKSDLLIVSQSGESFEAKELANSLGSFATVTNTPGSTLATKAANVYHTHAGAEKAIASSKSFTTTVALMLLLGGRTAGEEFASKILKAADILEEQLNQSDEYKKQICEFLNPRQPLILLGRGPSIYTARQGALTLKETARMFTEPMSAPQFRHGPFELIKEGVQAIFFNPYGKTHDINRRYVTEMAELGGKVVYVSDEPLNHPNILSIQIPSVDEYASVISYSLVTQIAAMGLSEQKGLVAGEAELISKVTVKE